MVSLDSGESDWTERKSLFTQVSLTGLRFISLDSEDVSLDSGECQWTQKRSQLTQFNITGLR